MIQGMEGDSKIVFSSTRRTLCDSSWPAHDFFAKPRFSYLSPSPVHESIQLHHTWDICYRSRSTSGPLPDKHEESTNHPDPTLKLPFNGGAGSEISKIYGLPPRHFLQYSSQRACVASRQSRCIPTYRSSPFMNRSAVSFG